MRLSRNSLMVGLLALVPAMGACGDEPAPTGPATEPVARQITLPPGFRIAVWAGDVRRPRSMALADDGTVFVGTYFFTKGVTSPIYALRDVDGDHRAEERTEIWKGFNTPNGIDYHDGTLYVVDEDRVFRMDRIEELLDRATPVLINASLPSRAETDQATNVGHWWRYLRYGPDDRLYITVGTRWSFLVGAHTARDLDDPAIYSTIVRMSPDGSGLEIFADGVRNSMGLDFDPVSGDVWFTDNGPSWPFDDPRFYDIPPDELNRASSAGDHFGFPYVHGRLDDPLIGSTQPVPTRAPEWEFSAHTAPLGMRFYKGDMFPEAYRGAIFVAEHGTEATTPAPLDKIHGDRISVLFRDASGAIDRYEVFADGFLTGSNATYSRRPVDLLVLSDGSLLVSDDQAHAIYRIWYEP